MVAVGVEVNSTGLQLALRAFEREFPKTVNVALEQESKKVIADAKQVHRFKSRTGNLKSALGSTVSNEMAEFYISDAQASYGKYIHDGTRRWTADPFLANAVNKDQQNMTNAVSKAIDNLIVKEGLK